MLDLDLHDLDPAYGQAVRSRLSDRGHRVRRLSSAVRGEPADVRLVVTGHLPVTRSELPDLLRQVIPAGRAAVEGLLVLVAALEPTQEAVAALYAAGFDAVLGVSAQRDLERHIEALGLAVRRALERQRGALPKPAELDAAVAAAQHAERQAQERSQRRAHGLHSLADPDLRAAAERVAFERRAVLVRGEAGAGRRHFARVLHTLGERPGPFVEVAAERFELPRPELEARLTTLLEHTRGGTLCVLGHEALSRDARRAISAAIHRARAPRLAFIGAPDAASDADDAHAPHIVDVPPLRAALHTLPHLAARLFDGIVPPETLRCLAAYKWPGNVAELAATLARASKRASDGELRPEHLPRALRTAYERARADEVVHPEAVAAAAESWQIGPEDPLTHGFYERKRLLRALVVARFNRTEAADLAHMSRSTFYRKLREFGLSGPRVERSERDDGLTE